MSFRIPGGLVYEAADLGLNGVAVPAAGAIVNSTLIVPWAALGRIVGVTIVSQADASGATPYDLFFRPFDFAAATYVAGPSASSAWSGITNNPRVQHGHWSLDLVSFAGSSGASPAGEFARAFGAPFMQFGVRNNHATIAMTGYVLKNVIFQFSA